MDRWVEIEFDCLPLRSVGRLDIPLDASPVYRRRCESIKRALSEHGSHNTYYLHHAKCVFHLANHPEIGQLQFTFEGTLFTDEEDRTCRGADLQVELLGETCDWLTQPIVEWFRDTVRRAVVIEFDRFIAAGDLEQTRARIDRMRQQTDEGLGFLGMDV